MTVFTALQGGRRPRFLHVHSSFGPGGAQVRIAQLINAWGQSVEHLMVAANPGQRGAMALIDPAAPVRWLEDFPALKGGALPARLRRVGAGLRAVRPDLLLSYNWGAVDVLLANRLFVRAPAVHHEEGFGPEEAAGPLPRRSLYRRFAFPGASRVVTVSRNLERLALNVWKQPRGRVVYLPNGVDVATFDNQPSPDAIPGWTRPADALVVGTVAGLRPEKNVARLVRMFAAIAADVPRALLVIVGDGPERAALAALAARLGVADRLIMPGFVPCPARYIGLFDLFALSSDTEQFPISVAEAMAARLPVVTTAVGDIMEMVAAANRPHVVAKEDEAAFANALRALLGDAALRKTIGADNWAKVAADYGFDSMVDRYAALYEGVMRPHLGKDRA